MVGSTATLVMAFNLAAFIGAKASLGFATLAGLATGLGWVAMSLGVLYLFERRSLKLWLINSGYLVLAFTVIPVLSSWLLQPGKHAEPWLMRRVGPGRLLVVGSAFFEWARRRFAREWDAIQQEIQDVLQRREAQA